MARQASIAREQAQPRAIVPVLLVSEDREDHEYFAQLLDDPRWDSYFDSRFHLYSTDSIDSAVAILKNNRIPIVLSERDAGSRTWKDLLQALTAIHDPPFLIVVSRLADEHLWAEALNLGAYDVLAKPFAAEEVIRIVSLAWLHWKDLHGSMPQTRRASSSR